MTPDEDDDALTWDGARDPSHYETPVAKPVKPAKVGAGGPSTSSETGVGAGAEIGAAGAAAETAGMNTVASSALLISLGVFVGVYALYTIGWFVSWQKFTYTASDQLDQVAFLVQQLLAIIAPAVWFGTTVFLTRGRKPALRLVWLLIGALVLIPWSFTMGL